MTHINARKENHVGLICLNRPDALNALNLAMVDAIKHALNSWLDDEDIFCVLLTSSSSRAFCAGGDVREAVGLIKQNPELSAEPYFEAEYGLDLVIANYPKPIISLVDGIVMGGGLGLARLSKYMIISAHIKCAMPETAIGLFPDVGASKFLRTMPEAAILMMGMTGTILGAGDVLQWGLADAVVEADNFKSIISDLISANTLSDTDLLAIINNYQTKSPPALYGSQRELINAIFNNDSPQQILEAALSRADDNSEAGRMARQWADALSHKSPTSIALFWAMIKRLPEPETTSQAIQRDFHLARKMMRRSDFIEGVRAVLIDKDNQPQWQPSTLKEADDDLLASLCDFTDMPLLPLPPFLLKTNN